MKQASTEIVIWDPLVRIFHWSTALLFLLNITVLEDGGTLHEWVGYTIAALVMVRILWGFIGSERARFRSFYPTRTRIRHHLNALWHRRTDPAEGHNPLGGAMVLALLFMLLLVALSGWMLTWDLFWGEDLLEEVHEAFANLTIFLVGVHVAAVLIMPRLTGIALIRPMISGKRSLK